MGNKHWLLMALLGLVTSCNNESISGIWTQPIPGQEGRTQGMMLNENGTASSVNMATLQYESWKKVGDQLILTGKSIGNHQTISFTDTLTIHRLTVDSLILDNAGFKQFYTRVKEGV